MFERLGAFAVRRARLVLAATVALLIGAAVLGIGAFGKLQEDGFTDPAAESSRAAELVAGNFDGDADLVLLVQAETGSVDDAAVADTGRRVATELADEPGVRSVTSYWDTSSPGLRTADGEYALILATGGDGAEIAERYATTDGAARVLVGGPEGIGADIGEQIGSDLALAELIAVPIILLLLLLAFRTVVAALLPLAIGVLAIFGTFAELSILASITDVSIYAINLTTALGLGLAVDYALLIVSRYREELGSGADVGDAVARTVATAGRTVVFSAATVAAALAVLVVFPLYFLRSFAYAGIGVVAISAISAIVVLPALLAVLGHRVDSLKVPFVGRRPASASAPLWGRIASVAWRRPLLTALPVVAVLAFAAVPLLRVDFGMPDDRVLPVSADSRQVGDALRDHFDADSTSAIDVVTTGPVDGAALSSYASELAALPGVARVETSAGTFDPGSPTPVVGPTDARLASADGLQRLSVVSAADPASAEAQELVRDVRAVPSPGEPVLVGGRAATLVDTLASIGNRLPLAIGLIVLTTFVLLFLFTGSLLQPIRSLVLNTLTLGATLGAMVWVFQEGHLASWLGFTPMPLDTSMLLLLFCVAFGLSMDYEVFVLSRVKELHDSGADGFTTATDGLARTGRIVTTAAALLAVNFFAFGTADISFLQLFGLGTGLAILIDATLVRAILVPAALRLLGRAAWWAPSSLRLLHRRVGLSEAAPPPDRSLIDA